MQAAAGTEYCEPQVENRGKGTVTMSDLPADVTIVFRAAQGCGVPSDVIARAASRFRSHVTEKEQSVTRI
jgi:hypothetical protein